MIIRHLTGNKPTANDPLVASTIANQKDVQMFTARITIDGAISASATKELLKWDAAGKIVAICSILSHKNGSHDLGFSTFFNMEIIISADGKTLSIEDKAASGIPADTVVVLTFLVAGA